VLTYKHIVPALCPLAEYPAIGHWIGTQANRLCASFVKEAKQHIVSFVCLSGRRAYCSASTQVRELTTVRPANEVGY